MLLYTNEKATNGNLPMQTPPLSSFTNCTLHTVMLSISWETIKHVYGTRSVRYCLLNPSVINKHVCCKSEKTFTKQISQAHTHFNLGISRLLNCYFIITAKFTVFFEKTSTAQYLDPKYHGNMSSVPNKLTKKSALIS